MTRRLLGTRALALLALASAMAALPAQASPSADAALSSSVALLLRDDRFLDADAIEVAATDGIVQLSGSVATLTSKARAARVAATRQGVRLVVNRIRRKLERRPDDEVVRAVRQALRSHAATANLGIAVSASGGVVTLSGTITSLTQQELAERIAGTVRGVRFCHNDLGISRRSRRTAAAVVGDVRSRLDWDPLLAGSKLEVRIKNGRIVLSGSTSSEMQRKQAVRDAWVKGVVAVDATGIVVDGQSAGEARIRTSLPSDLEIASAIRDALSHNMVSKPSTIGVRASAGVVRLDGTTGSLAEAQLAEVLALSAVGTIRVENELRGPWWKSAAPAAARPRRAGPRKR